MESSIYFKLIANYNMKYKIGNPEQMKMKKEY